MENPIGMSLYLDIRGSGPAVVLLHGCPSSPDDYAPLAERLARRHRVVVPHLHGYGRSDCGPRPYSLGRAVSDLESRLLNEGITAADFVGFSGGAYKVVAIALGDRVAVSRLVLLAPAIGLDADVAQGYRDVAAAVRSGALDARTTWLDRMASPGFATRDPTGAARVLAWLDAVPQPVVCDELVAFADADDLRPRLGSIDCPVLVCAGTADRAVPMSWSEDVVRRLSRASLERIDGAGHALLIEAPDRVERVIEEFLESATGVELEERDG